jgi:ADP-ribose pyrophosphatase YjhB (NUDIX family)
MGSFEINFCPGCGQKLIERYLYEANRMVCPDCNYIHFPCPKLVVAVIVEHKGKILLGRRLQDPGGAKWAFPGGYVNAGEKLEMAALREVKEETNLDVQLGNLVGLYSENDNPIALAVYSARIRAEQFRLVEQPQEISELTFFNLDEFKKLELAFPEDRQILFEWKRKGAKNSNPLAFAA